MLPSSKRIKPESPKFEILLWKEMKLDSWPWFDLPKSHFLGLLLIAAASMKLASGVPLSCQSLFLPSCTPSSALGKH